MGKITSVNLSDDHDQFIKTNFPKGYSHAVKMALDVLQRYNHGELVDAKAITEGKDDQNCLFNMPSLDNDNSTLVCPVKMKFPGLGSESRIDELLSCCRRCPRYAEHLQRIKVQAKYPNAFKKKDEQPASEPGEKPQKQQEAPKDVVIKCESCGAECALSDYKDFGTPLLAMRNAMLQHVKARHYRDYLKPSEWPTNLVQKLYAGKRATVEKGEPAT